MHSRSLLAATTLLAVAPGFAQSRWTADGTTVAPQNTTPIAAQRIPGQQNAGTNLLDYGSLPQGVGRTVSGTSISGGWTVFQQFDVPDPEGWSISSIGIDGWEVLDPLGTNMTLIIYADDGTGTAADLGSPIGPSSNHEFQTCGNCSAWTCEAHPVHLPGNGARYWAVTSATDQVGHWSAIYLAPTGPSSYSIQTSSGNRFDAGPTALRIEGFVGGPVTKYCTAKSGLVCGVPAIDFSGTPSAGATSGFTISAAPARGNRTGLVLYGCNGPAAIPFQGGILCVNPAPVRRTTIIGSGGTNGACDGVFAIDFNAFASGGLGGNPDPCLSVSGQQVNAQVWGRDSVATGSFLSNALEFEM